VAPCAATVSSSVLMRPSVCAVSTAITPPTASVVPVPPPTVGDPAAEGCVKGDSLEDSFGRSVFIPLMLNVKLLAGLVFVPLREGALGSSIVVRGLVAIRRIQSRDDAEVGLLYL